MHKVRVGYIALRAMDSGKRRIFARAHLSRADAASVLGKQDIGKRLDVLRMTNVQQTRSHNVQSRDYLADEVDRQNAYERLPADLSAYLVRMVDGDYRVPAEREALLKAIAGQLRAEYDRKAAELEEAKLTCALADEFGEEAGIKTASEALHECMRLRWPSWRDAYERMPRAVLADLSATMTDKARGDALGRSRQNYLVTWARPYRWLLGRWFEVLCAGRGLVRETQRGA